MTSAHCYCSNRVRVYTTSRSTTAEMPANRMAFLLRRPLERHSTAERNAFATQRFGWTVPGVPMTNECWCSAVVVDASPRMCNFALNKHLSLVVRTRKSRILCKWKTMPNSYSLNSLSSEMTHEIFFSLAASAVIKHCNGIQLNVFLFAACVCSVRCNAPQISVTWGNASQQNPIGWLSRFVWLYRSCQINRNADARKLFH